MLPAAEPARGDPSRAAQLLAGLDPAQVAAVTTPSTLVAVIAGAGSGKTRVLTTRIAHRIAIGTADARHTLALTFTREAAGELRRRLRRSGVRDHVEAGTFHAVALALLRQRWADLDQRPPTVVGDRERLLGRGRRRRAARRRSPRRPTGPRPGASRADGYVAAARAAGRRGADAARPHRRGARPPTRRSSAGAASSTSTTCWRSRRASWPPTRRGPTPCASASATCSSTRPRTSTRCSTGCSSSSSAGATTSTSSATRRRRSTGSTARIRACCATSPRGCPGVEVIHLPTNHRCTPQIVAAGAARAAGRRAGQRRRVGRAATARPCASWPPTTRTTRRRSSPRSVALARPGRRARRGGRRAGPHERPAGAAGDRRSPPPACRSCGASWRRDRRSAAVVRAVTALPSASRLRGWAHDVLEDDRGRRRPIPSRAPSGRSPRPCSSSCASSRSATARRCGRGSRRRTRSPSRRRRRRRGPHVPRRQGTGVARPSSSPASRPGWCRTARRRPPRPAPRRPACCTSPSRGPPTASCSRGRRGGAATAASPAR